MTNPTTLAENATVTRWQDKAWLFGGALGTAVAIALTAIGVRFWGAALVGSVLVAMGGTISTRSSLARLDEATRRRHVRSIAIGLILAALVLIFYAATIVRLGGNVMNRAL